MDTNITDLSINRTKSEITDRFQIFFTSCRHIHIFLCRTILRFESKHIERKTKKLDIAHFSFRVLISLSNLIMTHFERLGHIHMAWDIKIKV